MGEMDENQQTRLFDTLLNEAEKWNTAPRAQARRAVEADQTVADDLSLIVALREMKPPRSETEFARARVGQRLANLMSAEPMTPPATSRARAWLRAVTSPPARAARPTAPPAVRTTGAPAMEQPLGVALRRISALAAVALTIAFVLLAGASVASAHALPESPFYSVKRAEEATLLALAWNDESKGQTLAMIANHRITEAVAEADQRHNAEAHLLLGEFDTALGSLIDLTAHAQATHEDTRALVSAVQTTLEAERNAAAQARAHGELAFAAEANASVAAATAHIQRVGVPIHVKSGQDNSNKGNNSKGSGQNNGPGSTTGKPEQTPGVSATHTPHTGQSGAGSSTKTPPSGK